MCRHCFHQRSLKIFKNKKYSVLTPKLFVLIKHFDDKTHVCETSHKHLLKSETPFQAVCNKMELHLTTNELKTFKRLDRSLNLKKNFVKKIGIMYGKGEFSKIKGLACNDQ